MKGHSLGRTGPWVSPLGFGCGSVGGILVRGEYPAMRQAVSRAVELGINYFDTAPHYGSGQSEVNLGAVLRELKADVVIGTKVRLTAADMGGIGAAIVRSAEGSLRRLGREAVDLIQLHNHVGRERRIDHNLVSLEDLGEAVRAFESLHRQGKIRAWGITGMGPSEALQEAVEKGMFQTIQLPYNLINQTAAAPPPAGFPFQDFGGLIGKSVERGMGVIAIRILAGGALSGTMERHPVAAKYVNPIASETFYSGDVARARRYEFLVKEGKAENLVEAAVRFAVSNPGVATALLGISSLDQLEQAARYAERGPLPAEALERIREAWLHPEQKPDLA
jgi:aryl-alcohol dehydrogenase-like predicted oxidoreductase